jgi:hypothetical protein
MSRFSVTGHRLGPCTIREFKLPTCGWRIIISLAAGDVTWLPKAAGIADWEAGGGVCRARPLRTRCLLISAASPIHGKDNVLLFPLPTQAVRGEQEKVRCRERLGGLLKYYEREAA